MNKHNCPYCSKKIKVELNDSRINCPHCGETILIGITDYNGHSPKEINEDFPDKFVYGELTQVLFKQDQNFCELCGAVYESNKKVCPGLIKNVEYWLNHPEELCESSKLNTIVVQSELNKWLKSNT